MEILRNFINKLRIKNQLILLAVIPLLIILPFLAIGIWDRSQLLIEMNKINDFADLAIKINNLTYELQKERGLTFGFVSSRGRVFTSQMEAQRLNTDKSVHDLNLFLDRFEVEQFDYGLQGDFASAINALGELDNKRESIDRLGNAELVYFDYYTGLIGSFSRILGSIARVSTNKDISSMIYSYTYLTYLREYAGQERALLGSAFAVDKFNPGIYEKFIAAMKSQDVYENLFFLFASQDERSFYRAKMNDDAKKESDGLRDVAIKKAEKGGFGVDSQHWFDIQSGKIDSEREVENMIAEDFDSKAHYLRYGAIISLVLFIAAIFVVLFFSSFLIMSILRMISDSLSRLVGFSRKVTEGDLLFRDDVIVKMDNEFGYLARHINMMVDGLVEAKKIPEDILFSMGEGLIVTDSKDEIKVVNYAILDLLGYTKDDLLGKPVNKIIPEDMIIPYSNEQKGGYVKNVRASLLGKDKRTVPVNISETIIADKAGSAAGRIIVAKDMSEVLNKLDKLKKAEVAMINILEDSKEFEENLRKERDRSEIIISSIGEGLLVVDENFSIISANGAAGSILRVYIKEMIGQDVRNLFKIYQGDNLVSHDDAYFKHVFEKGAPKMISLSDEFAYEISDKKIPVSFVVTPLKRHKVEAAIMVFRDISEEKRLDDSKTDFISVASHQLRTPLTSMRWFSEMLIEGDAGKISKKQKHFLERIYEGTDRMIALVNLLLQIARVDAGRIRVEPAPIDLKKVAEEIVAEIAVQLEAKSNKVKISSKPAKLPLVQLDKEVIWQIILNLLTNANRYSGPKAVINVQILDKGGFLEFSVKDNGIGIPKSQQDQIFKKFFRADNAFKRVPEGSGLGLSLVKSLVDAFGGKVWFETEEGKGTTFFFTVPKSGMIAKTGEVSLAV